MDYTLRIAPDGERAWRAEIVAADGRVLGHGSDFTAFNAVEGAAWNAWGNADPYPRPDADPYPRP